MTAPVFDSAGRLTSRSLIGAHNRASTRAVIDQQSTDPLPPLLRALSERVGELASLSGSGLSAGGGAGAAVASVKNALYSDLLAIIESLHADYKTNEQMKAVKYREYRLVVDERNALRSELDELKQRVHALDLGSVMDHGALSLSVADIEYQIKQLLQFGDGSAGTKGGSATTDVDDLLEKIGATTSPGAKSKDGTPVPPGPAGTAVTFHDRQNLVFLKFKRLEQLIYCLRRRLSLIELHGQRTDVINQYGSVDNLLTLNKQLTTENDKLRRRELRFVHHPLLKRRALAHASTPLVHGLVIALQNELTACEQVTNELDSVPSSFVAAVPPPDAITLAESELQTPFAPSFFRPALTGQPQQAAKGSDAADGRAAVAAGQSEAESSLQQRLETEQLRTSALQASEHPFVLGYRRE